MASVEVSDCIRGDLAAGGYLQRGVSRRAWGHHLHLRGPGEPGRGQRGGVHAPHRHAGHRLAQRATTTSATPDLAELYMDEGRRFLFLDTGDGVSYAAEVYDIPAAERGDGDAGRRDGLPPGAAGTVGGGTVWQNLRKSGGFPPGKGLLLGAAPGRRTAGSLGENLQRPDRTGDYPAAIMVDGTVYLVSVNPLPAGTVDEAEITGCVDSYTETFPRKRRPAEFQAGRRLCPTPPAEGRPCPAVHDGAWYLCVPRPG